MDDYFAAIEKLYNKLTVPTISKSLPAAPRPRPSDIEQKFATANQAPNDGISRFVPAKRIFGSGNLSDEGFPISGVPEHGERMPRQSS